jgi:hypothetical protein
MIFFLIFLQNLVHDNLDFCYMYVCMCARSMQNVISFSLIYVLRYMCPPILCVYSLHMFTLL